MSKLSKLGKAIAAIIRQPSLLNNVLNDAEVNKAEVTSKYDLPEGLLSVSITELLGDIHETVSPYCCIDGGSIPMDFVLLKGLAKKFPDCNYFEIGTWRGESAANVASVAKHCTTLNLPDAEMLAMGLDKKYVELHRFFSKAIPNVTHLQGNSHTFDFKGLGQKFDLVFVDGDHHYESVKSDTANAFSLLKNEHSIIVWHDYGNNPTDVRWDVLKGILDGCPPEKQKNIYRVNNTLCAIYTTLPLKAYQQATFQTPVLDFQMDITSKKV